MADKMGVIYGLDEEEVINGVALFMCAHQSASAKEAESATMAATLLISLSGVSIASALSLPQRAEHYAAMIRRFAL
jgi:hypothetical protein